MESELPADDGDNDEVSTLAPTAQSSAQLDVDGDEKVIVGSASNVVDKASEVSAVQAGDGNAIETPAKRQDSSLAEINEKTAKIDVNAPSNTMPITDATTTTTTTTDVPVEHTHSHETHALAESSDSYRQSVYYEALDTPHQPVPDALDHTDVFVDASSDIIMREGSGGNSGSRPISMTGSLSEMTQEHLRSLCPGQTSVDLYLQGVDNMVRAVSNDEMLLLLFSLELTY